MIVVEYIVVGAIVVFAAVMLVGSLRSRKGGDCGCGCDDCPVSDSCRRPKRH